MYTYSEELLENRLINLSNYKEDYRKIINKYGYNNISKIGVMEELLDYIKTNNLKTNKISKYILTNLANKKHTKKEKLKYRSFEFNRYEYMLVPYLVSSEVPFIDFNDIYISDKNIASGTYSAIYLNLFKKDNKQNNNSKFIPLNEALKMTLFTIKDHTTALYDEFIANLINYILCKVYNNPISIVKIYEFGVMKTPYTGIYSILEKCNFDLNYYIEKRDVSYLKDISKLITFFYKLLTGIKLLHDIGYIHLDIKIKNYLVKIENDKKLSIKLTDFGFLKRIGASNPLAATQLYSDPRLLKDDTNQLHADKMMDIFSVGVVFIDILLAINNERYYHICPFLKHNQYERKFMREFYYTDKYPNNNFETDIIKIKKLYEVIPSEYAKRLCEINIRMLSDTYYRYKTVDALIHDLVILHKEVKRNKK